MSSPLALTLAVALFVMSDPSSGEKVVFIPLSQSSHVRASITMAEEMSSMGHDTWVVVSQNLEAKFTKMAPSVGRVIYALGGTPKDVEDSMVKSSGVLESFWEKRDMDLAAVMRTGDIIWQNAIDTLDDPAFISGVRDVDPELIVLDGSAFCKVNVIVPYKLGKPFAFFGTFMDPLTARIPFSAACNPMVMTDLSDADMSFSQRIINLLTLSALLMQPMCDDTLIAKYVPEKPYIRVSDLAAKAEVFVVETDHILDYPRPQLPNTKLIGGTTARSAKPLHEPFSSMADHAKRGMVIVTFGSTVLDLPETISDMMLEAFRQLSFQVIWRANISKKVPDNVYTSTWLPQNDLLGHEHTHVFVSHCGAGGLYEALQHGVPVLCAPMFADQFHNARRLVDKGYGLRVDIRTVTASELARMINELVADPQYKTNIRKASSLFKQLFKEPIKTGAFWFDHVIQHGGNYMRFAGQDMPVYKFLLLDVIAALLGALFLGIIFLYLSFKCVCMYRRSVQNRVAHQKFKDS